jgi:putative acetyltransferase
LSEGLTIAVERAERENVRALLRTVSSWSVELYPPESRHGLDLAAYRRPDVTLFVAHERGVALGCGA